MKINQVKKNDIEVRVELNTDMIAEMMENSEVIKNYWENIMIVGALKGYRVEQETREFTFWTKHTISLKRDDYNVHCSFTVKSNRVDSFEIKSHITELKESLLQCLGVDIKMILVDVFFTYHHKGILKMLQVLQEFVVGE